MNINAMIGRWIAKRAEKLPMVKLTAPPFMYVGGIFGGSWGFGKALRENDGGVWRTSLGIVTGGTIGLVTGLYPYQMASLLIVTDVAYTVYNTVYNTVIIPSPAKK
jgi:hypothetical protein